MYCVTKKADILFLLTLAYNKITIAGTLNIIQKFMQMLGLIEKVIYKKVILKDNLLIV